MRGTGEKRMKDEGEKEIKQLEKKEIEEEIILKRAGRNE